MLEDTDFVTQTPHWILCWQCFLSEYPGFVQAMRSLGKGWPGSHTNWTRNEDFSSPARGPEWSYVHGENCSRPIFLSPVSSRSTTGSNHRGEPPCFWRVLALRPWSRALHFPGKENKWQWHFGQVRSGLRGQDGFFQVQPVKKSPDSCVQTLAVASVTASLPAVSRRASPTPRTGICRAQDQPVRIQEATSNLQQHFSKCSNTGQIGVGVGEQTYAPPWWVQMLSLSLSTLIRTLPRSMDKWTSAWTISRRPRQETYEFVCFSPFFLTHSQLQSEKNYFINLDSYFQKGPGRLPCCRVRQQNSSQRALKHPKPTDTWHVDEEPSWAWRGGPWVGTQEEREDTELWRTGMAVVGPEATVRCPWFMD